MKNIRYYLLLFLPSFIFTVYFAGCCPDGSCNCTYGYTTPTPELTPYLNIESITPNPYTGQGNLSVSIKAGGWGPSTCANADIEIWMLEGNDSCYTEYRGSACVYKDNPYTFTLDPHTFKPGCNLAEHSYRVRAYLYSGLGLTTQGTFYWGNSLSTIDVGIGRYRMYSTTTSECSDALTCVSNSFNNPNPDSNNVEIDPIFSSTFYGVRDENFVGITLNFMVNACDTFARSHHWTNDTLHIYYALDHNNDASYLGLTATSELDPGSTNWSYVFLDYINTYTPTNWNRQSVYNQASVHELMHQLGNIGLSGHLDHTDPFADRCALWPANHFGTGDFLRLTNFYRMCNKHIIALRTNLDGTLTSAGRNNSYCMPFPFRLSESKYKINMILSKKTYKEFEPIQAKFELINTDSKEMNIYNLFDSYMDEGHIFIKDNLGNIWSTHHTIGEFVYDYKNPKYIIQPNDTFVASMSINNWGETIKDHRNWLFGEFSYFPSGRNYEAYFYFDTQDSSVYKTALKSNKVEFEVSNLSNEDYEIIRIYKEIFGKITIDSAASIVASLYPNNTLTEYMVALGLSSKYALAKISKYKNSFDATALIEDYEMFFKKFPNTYYIYDDRFMAPYYFALFSGKTNHAKILSETMERNGNSDLKIFLSNTNMINRIKSVINRFQIKTKN